MHCRTEWSTHKQLVATVENHSASRSRVMDADFAAESAALSKAQVLAQASTAMLAQANAAPQLALPTLAVERIYKGALSEALLLGKRGWREIASPFLFLRDLLFYLRTFKQQNLFAPGRKQRIRRINWALRRAESSLQKRDFWISRRHLPRRLR